MAAVLGRKKGGGTRLCYRREKKENGGLENREILSKRRGNADRIRERKKKKPGQHRH